MPAPLCPLPIQLPPRCIRVMAKRERRRLNMACRSAPRRCPRLATLLLLRVAHARWDAYSGGGTLGGSARGVELNAGKGGGPLVAYDWSKSTADNHEVRGAVPSRSPSLVLSLSPALALSLSPEPGPEPWLGSEPDPGPEPPRCAARRSAPSSRLRASGSTTAGTCATRSAGRTSRTPSSERCCASRRRRALATSGHRVVSAICTRCWSRAGAAGAVWPRRISRGRSSPPAAWAWARHT